MTKTLAKVQRLFCFFVKHRDYGQRNGESQKHPCGQNCKDATEERKASGKVTLLTDKKRESKGKVKPGCGHQLSEGTHGVWAAEKENPCDKASVKVMHFLVKKGKTGKWLYMPIKHNGMLSKRKSWKNVTGFGFNLIYLSLNSSG